MSTSFGQFSIIHGGPESPAIFFTAHIFKMPESICVISINCKSVFLSCCLSTWLWTGLYDFYHGRFWLSLKMISFRGDPDWHSLELHCLRRSEHRRRTWRFVVSWKHCYSRHPLKTGHDCAIYLLHSVNCKFWHNVLYSAPATFFAIVSL